MLIHDEIKVHLTGAPARLVAVRPRTGWSGEPRCFLLERDLHEQIVANRILPQNFERWAKLEADMAHFVEGGYINWNMMKWLEPQKQEVWELKSVRPKPSIRVFGRFACPNVFIGTNIQFRNCMKEKWSKEFWDQIFECEKIWADLFKAEPFKGRDYTDYITENAEKRMGV
jgi:hypothetical protein